MNNGNRYFIPDNYKRKDFKGIPMRVIGEVGVAALLIFNFIKPFLTELVSNNFALFVVLWLFFIMFILALFIYFKFNASLSSFLKDLYDYIIFPKNYSLEIDQSDDDEEDEDYE